MISSRLGGTPNEVRGRRIGINGSQVGYVERNTYEFTAAGFLSMLNGVEDGLVLNQEAINLLTGANGTPALLPSTFILEPRKYSNTDRIIGRLDERKNVRITSIGISLFKKRSYKSFNA